MFYCLMRSGILLSDEVSNTLVRVARDMIRECLEILDFESDEYDCEGRVTTKGEHYSIGTIAGQKFSAEVVTNAGTTEVTFIVRTGDLEDWPVGRGVWDDLTPVFLQDPPSVRITHEAPTRLQ